MLEPTNYETDYSRAEWDGYSDGLEKDQPYI